MPAPSRQPLPFALFDGALALSQSMMSNSCALSRTLLDATKPSEASVSAVIAEGQRAVAATRDLAAAIPSTSDVETSGAAVTAAMNAAASKALETYVEKAEEVVEAAPAPKPAPQPEAQKAPTKAAALKKATAAETRRQQISAAVKAKSEKAEAEKPAASAPKKAAQAPAKV